MSTERKSHNANSAAVPYIDLSAGSTDDTAVSAHALHTSVDVQVIRLTRHSAPVFDISSTLLTVANKQFTDQNRTTLPRFK
jgi:hypothetical protein